MPLHVAALRRRQSFDPASSRPLPNNGDVDLIAEKDNTDRNHWLHYVKLHGSLNWLSANGGSAMVIGAEKSAMIEKEPLLRYYSRLFQRVLTSTRRLYIIGYRFADTNINESIARASVLNPDLGLYILNPTPVSSFHAELIDAPGQIDGHKVGPELGRRWPATFPGERATFFLPKTVRRAAERLCRDSSSAPPIVRRLPEMSSRVLLRGRSESFAMRTAAAERLTARGSAIDAVRCGSSLGYAGRSDTRRS